MALKTDWGAPLLLVNPPSPPGTTANREGFGGLGTLTKGRRGFAYPQQLLAELSGLLDALSVPYRSGDCVLQPIRGPARIFRRLPAIAGGYRVLVRSSAITFAQDLAWFQREFREPEHRAVFVGTRLDRFRAQDERIACHAVASGLEIAALLGPLPEEWKDADSVPLANFGPWPMGKGRRLSLYHARGCTHSCAYCPYVLATGRTLHRRSPERTVLEFAHHVKRHRPRRMVFRDPTFGLERDSALEVLKRLSALEEGSRAPFEIETRPEILDQEFVTALAKAGCVEIKLGVETFEAGPLVASQRVTSVDLVPAYREAALRAATLAREQRIFLRAFAMRGLFGSTGEVVGLPADELVVKDLRAVAEEAA